MNALLTLAQIEELARMLENAGDEPLELGAPQRTLLRAALLELAAAHRSIAVLRLLLASHGQESAEVERLSREAVLGAAAAPSPSAGYDHAGAERARRELKAAIEQHASGANLLSAVLRVAAIGARLIV